MLEAGVSVVLGTALMIVWEYSWPWLNRKYRGNEVDMVQERCCNLGDNRRIAGGRHCYLVLSTFSGSLLRLDFNENKHEIEVKSDYFDGWRDEIYRQKPALPGLSLENAVNIYRKRVEMKRYDAKEHCCQHVSRDTLNDLTGRQERELRSEFLQRIGHFGTQVPGYFRESVVYSHRLKLENEEYEPLKEGLELKEPDSEVVDLLYTFEPYRPIYSNK